jgi:hypothetical protein
MALSADVKIVRYGVSGNASQPVAPGQINANTTVYGGSICLTDINGGIKNAASPASTDSCWGLVHAQTINSSTTATTGIPMDINGRPFEVEVGTFFLNSGTGGQAITQAYIGKTVYVVDEITVGISSSGGTLPVAGILLAIDTTQPGGYAIKLGSNQSTGAPQ